MFAPFVMVCSLAILAIVLGVEITFGVSLSKAAIKALTQDIVWYENQTVELNGKQYTALMPRLYLAGATLEDLSKTRLVKEGVLCV
jgi:hypothetical protein